MRSVEDDVSALLVLFISAVFGSVCVTLTGFGFLLLFLVMHAVLGEQLPGGTLEGADKQWVVYTLGFISAVSLVILDRRHISWRWVALVATPSAVTAPAGVLVSAAIDSSLLMRLMAAIFLLAASQQLWDEWTLQRQTAAVGSPSEVTAEVRAGATLQSSARAESGLGLLQLEQEQGLQPSGHSFGIRGLSFGIRDWELLCTGTLAGFMGGLCAMPGPPIKVYCVARPLPPGYYLLLTTDY